MIGDELLIAANLWNSLYELLRLEPPQVPQHLLPSIRGSLELQELMSRELSEVTIMTLVAAVPGANQGAVGNDVVLTDSYLLNVHAEDTTGGGNLNRRPALWITPPPVVGGPGRTLYALWNQTTTYNCDSPGGALVNVFGSAGDLQRPTPLLIEAGTNFDLTAHTGAGGGDTVTAYLYLSTAPHGVKIAR